MAFPEITDELIVAFADGELSGTEAEMVRNAIENNPELKRVFENYSKSGEVLRDLFAVESEEKAPDHIAEDIRKFHQQKNYTKNQDSRDSNIISFDAFKNRVARASSVILASYGVQKIAASMLLGISVGVFGASQYSGSSQPGSLVFRGANDAADEIGFQILQDEKPLNIGVTIDHQSQYKIKITAKNNEKIKLLLHENGLEPVTLIRVTPMEVGEIIYYPEQTDKSFKVVTEGSFITFELVRYENNVERRIFLSYGMKKK